MGDTISQGPGTPNSWGWREPGFPTKPCAQAGKGAGPRGARQTQPIPALFVQIIRRAPISAYWVTGLCCEHLSTSKHLARAQVHFTGNTRQLSDGPAFGWTKHRVHSATGAEGPASPLSVSGRTLPPTHYLTDQQLPYLWVRLCPLSKYFEWIKPEVTWRLLESYWAVWPLCLCFNHPASFRSSHCTSGKQGWRLGWVGDSPIHLLCGSVLSSWVLWKTTT